MKKEIGSILRELREKSNYTVKYVIDRLKEYNIDISDKALYSYENNKRTLSADTFLVLCEIYGCKNILKTFSDIDSNSSIPDDSEWKIIEKYRDLDVHGKELVDIVLNKEFIRCTNDYVVITTDGISYTIENKHSDSTYNGTKNRFLSYVEKLDVANQKNHIKTTEGADPSNNDINFTK